MKGRGIGRGEKGQEEGGDREARGQRGGRWRRGRR